MKAVQVLLSPSKPQAKILLRILEEHRILYNHCLETKINAYENTGCSLTAFDLIKTEISLLREEGFIKKANVSSLQQTIRRLEKTYVAFFKGGGFPRFKGKDRFRTIDYSTRGDGWQIKGEQLYLQNVGLIKCRWFSDIEPTNFSITYRNGKFYANFLTASSSHSTTTGESVGIDFGFKTYITTSDDEKFDAPKPHKQTLKNEKQIHRRIHSHAKGSKLRNKHKKTLRRIKKRQADRRRDFNHKLSRKIVNAYDIIIVEDINLNDMTCEIANINRTKNDLGFGQFRDFLSYKAENAGKIFIKVDPRGTTQECFKCGLWTKKELSDRIHKCPCGHMDCRDCNSAKVIKRRGLASLEKS